MLPLLVLTLFCNSAAAAAQTIQLPWFSVAQNNTTVNDASAPRSTTDGKRLRDPDVVYVPTPNEVVDAMLRVAKVGEGDVLYDLGSGDGRIPIIAAQKYRVARAVGIDINPERIRQAEMNLKAARLGNRIFFQNEDLGQRVFFLNEDLFEAKISDATVVTLYLLPTLNLKLLPKLLSDLKPGTRIVSHAFNMGSWKPEQIVNVDGRTVYLWTIPTKGSAAYAEALAAPLR
jgi:SAM-dependent methyltransferase